MPLGPFDLTGGPFLILYGALLVATIVAGFAIPRWLRPDGRSVRLLDADHLAYLAGGATRFCDAVVTRLLASRALAITGKRRLSPAVRSGGHNPAERSVLAVPTDSSWSVVERALRHHAPPIGQRLVDDDLLMDGATALQLRIWQTAPYLLLFVFGAVKWEIGTMRDRPVGFLTLLLILTAVLAVIRFVAIDRRTKGGQEVLAEAQARADRLRRAPTATEADMAVALFGTAVLAGSAWAGYHQMRASSSSGDGGSSSDSGGCGGGGCGGCGS